MVNTLILAEALLIFRFKENWHTLPPGLLIGRSQTSCSMPPLKEMIPLDRETRINLSFSFLGPNPPAAIELERCSSNRSQSKF